jgi:PEP-CTERM motif
MRRMFRATLFVLPLTLGFASLPTPAPAGMVGYTVTVDTTGLFGLPGNLETQLSAATAPVTPSVTATIDNVATDGVFGATSTTGDVTGAFNSTPLVLDNASVTPYPGFSDFAQAFTYGTSLSFNLTLSGSDIGSANSSGTVFVFILEDANYTGLNNGPLVGEAFDIYVNPDGSVNVTPNQPTTSPVPGYDPTNPGGPVVTIGPQIATPEPASALLLGFGAAGLGGFGYRRKAARARRSE